MKCGYFVVLKQQNIILTNDQNFLNYAHVGIFYLNSYFGLRHAKTTTAPFLVLKSGPVAKSPKEGSWSSPVMKPFFMAIGMAAFFMASGMRSFLY